jgi:hypothetical protein
VLPGANVLARANALPARGCAFEEDHDHVAMDEPFNDADPASPAEDASDEILPAAERARMRRRDHDASAHDRELMNDGSAKWFKQVLDRQARAARDSQSRRPPLDR